MDLTIEYLLESPKSRCTEKHIMIRFPEEYKKIIKCVGESFGEKLYNFMYDNPSHSCIECGKETRFRNFVKGYDAYCCQECAIHGKTRSDQIRRTCTERYGVDNPSQLDSIKEKKKETITKNYGGFGFASKEIAKRSYKVIKEKYGTDNPSQSDIIKTKKRETLISKYGTLEEAGKCATAKRTKTCLERYGVRCPLDIDRDNNTKKASRAKRKNFLVQSDVLVDFTDAGDWICKCPHPDSCNKCTDKQFIIPQGTYHDRLRWGSEVCTNLLPISQTHSTGTTLELFVRGILDKYNIEYQTNVRTIIPPKELDIYIPSKKIAIECNGVYWHSRKDSKYHMDKWLNCKELGVQLLTVWEDWIVSKPDIIESVLLSKLGIYKERLYARNCDVKEMKGSEYCKFLNDNHIQGQTKSHIKLGLYDKRDDKLLGVMTFSSRSKLSGSKRINENEYELTRFCTMKGVQVIGGAERLLKHFIREYNPVSIISFSSNDISNGNLYKQLGFEESSVNAAYWYIDPTTMVRYHRSSFTKSSIRNKRLLLPDHSDWTEEEAMRLNKYIKVYDSGQTKWSMILDWVN